MAAAGKDPAGLVYPVFLIESRKDRKLTGFDVVRKPCGYTPLFRMPRKGEFVDGLVFDRSGRVCH